MIRLKSLFQCSTFSRTVTNKRLFLIENQQGTHARARARLLFADAEASNSVEFIYKSARDPENFKLISDYALAGGGRGGKRGLASRCRDQISRDARNQRHRVRRRATFIVRLSATRGRGWEEGGREAGRAKGNLLRGNRRPSCRNSATTLGIPWHATLEA